MPLLCCRFKVQAQSLSYLSHRDPGGGNGRPKIGQHAHGQDHSRAPQSSTIMLKRRPRSC
jgi:hypothetical protein